MKTFYPISLLSLFISLAALVISVRNSVWPTSVKLTDAEIDYRIEAGLKRKEQQYVRALTPKMDLVYRDMVPNYVPPEKQPETLAELFAPAARIISGLTTK